MLELKTIDAFKEWLKTLENDKITRILIRNSNLTQIQFETFLIDLFFRQNDYLNSEKYKIRLNKNRISRGAFNHSRKQAINNIIKSIYTILLLGYYGILETPQLEPFVESANRLHSYILARNENDSKILEKNLDLLGRILEDELYELSLRKTYYK